MSGHSSPAVKAGSSGPPPPLDPFRVLPSGLRKPTLSFSEAHPPPTSSSVQDILNISPIAYSARLAGRQLLLDERPQNAAGVDVKLSKKAKGKQKELNRVRNVKDVKKRKKESRKRREMEQCKEKGKERSRLKAGDYINYDRLLPLHYLHLSYLSELFPLPPLPTPSSTSQQLPPSPVQGGGPSVGKLENGLGMDNMQGKLIKAEFTGGTIRVKAANNPHLVGLEGIVVMETAETFYIAAKDNLLKLIPKKNSLFTFYFPAYSFASLAPLTPDPISSPTTPALYTPPQTMATILANTPHIEIDVLGGAIRFRAADRAGRRFKVANGGGGWIGDWIGDKGFGII